jgi:hypothetical protein
MAMMAEAIWNAIEGCIGIQIEKIVLFLDIALRVCIRRVAITGLDTE